MPTDSGTNQITAPALSVRTKDRHSYEQLRTQRCQKKQKQILKKS